MTEHVLIHNGDGVGPKSRDDLKKLFEEYNIYPSTDVRLTNFTGNFSGLEPKQTTIVLPGGSVCNMGISLQAYQTKIRDFFDRGCNGVFICAGAYLATNNADIFKNEYTRKNEGEFNELSYQANIYSCSKATEFLEYNLNIVSDYKAMGPFIPNDAYRNTPPAVNLGASVRKPYCVSLFHEEASFSFNEIYAGGPGFKPITAQAEERYEVLATYQERSLYTFFQPPGKPTEVIENMPAMIRAKDRGVFLSATHIETCVEDSKLLKLMQEGDEDTIPLPGYNNYDAVYARALTTSVLGYSLRRLTS
jgi:glutamine amidotransferase-like uncharacterized protein